MTVDDFRILWFWQVLGMIGEVTAVTEDLLFGTLNEIAARRK